MRSNTGMRTVRDVIAVGAKRLAAARLAFGHGTENALDEATYLVLHALELPVLHAERHLDRRLAASEVRAAFSLLDRRIRSRHPAAYLTREAWLGPYRFYVDERAIVPRSYLAEWIRNDLATWIPHPQRIEHALDLCTGSGCLAVLLAKALEQAQIDATDISADALAVARRNVARYRLRARVRLIEADLFVGLGGRRYDLIVANPPYVTAHAMARLPAEYRAEPRLALAGGRDGLDYVRRIMAEAIRHLRPQGLLVVETGHARKRVERAFPRIPFTWIETSAGADAVFLLGREALAQVEAAGASAAEPASYRRPRAPRASSRPTRAVHRRRRAATTGRA